MSTDGYDRRVQRTRGLLHGALASLIHEKPYDGIVVKEILARANVGRSTFYNHFQDKEDLLESSIRDVVDEGKTQSPPKGSRFGDQLLQRTLRLFEHIDRHRSAAQGPMDMRRQDMVHERLQEQLVRSITEDLERVPADQCESQHVVPPDLIAQFVASTFIVVLKWWFDSRSSLSAREVNNLFGAMVLPGISGSG